MAIRFAGEFATERAPDEVYDLLINPMKFGPLLPSFQGMTQEDATHFTVKVSVGASSLTGSVDMKMELSEADRPLRAQYAGESDGLREQCCSDHRL
jgi:carbon monoxide dehydrogenase subunit G